MSKFIDLADRVYNDRIGAYQDEINAVLNWLDSHPDQVPGRTITESEWVTATWELHGNTALGFKLGLNFAGITIVPDQDPVPTNLEKLEVIVWDTGDISGSHALVIAKALDKAGVKAPDHD